MSFDTTQPALPAPVKGQGSQIRVLLVEDHVLLRTALQAVFSLEADIEVVAAIGDGAEVLSTVRRTAPDVIVLDIHLPTIDGLGLLPLIQAADPRVKVLLLASHPRPGDVRRAIQGGVDGFQHTDLASERLIAVIRKIRAGERVVDPQLAINAMMHGESPLTARETEVLFLAAGGRSAPEVARALHLSPGAVRNYLSAASAKLGASNRSEAIRIATDKGWI
ncbi:MULTISPECIES: response regulator transcription factor [unclassified Cryobacterium]|uniref:response regulator transcription factor n=1 Tax=unclassified Cryobacterium TaxID=2649013 RepID=UPI00106D57CC|nr:MULTISPECIES: response regulator transcription factor [unclassified Cryobacterium]MDY7529039.1 response regulator transcription factor [Cryobacterium sp. 10C2]MEB0203122.1 response regulator transcription factor [Cryobacterium sp. 5I3]MEB0285684.1 response regulator transcription factor [Cryobacterium sp. 10S3]MEB0289909.1 response regulator transcription factor [Cryobacterium sp. 10C2]MEB0305233.1 response regulator transcription factor [Cryobacterium sp. 10I1]